MIRLLLENGLDREYFHRGRRIEIRGDTIEGVDSGVRFQRKMQDVMKPIDEKGYVVLIGDKIDKSKGSREAMIGEKDEYWCTKSISQVKNRSHVRSTEEENTINAGHPA
jgi:hypothetical protein